MGSGQTISMLYLDGTGVSPVRRILEKAPFQHGMSDRGYRNEPRRMTLALEMERIEVQLSTARLWARLEYVLPNSADLSHSTASVAPDAAAAPTQKD